MAKIVAFQAFHMLRFEVKCKNRRYSFTKNNLPYPPQLMSEKKEKTILKLKSPRIKKEKNSVYKPYFKEINQAGNLNSIPHGFNFDQSG